MWGGGRAFRPGDSRSKEVCGYDDCVCTCALDQTMASYEPWVHGGEKMGGGRTGWRFSSLGEVFISDLMVKRVVFQILLRNHANKNASCLGHRPPCADSVIVNGYNMMQS